MQTVQHKPGQGSPYGENLGSRSSGRQSQKPEPEPTQQTMGHVGFFNFIADTLGTLEKLAERNPSTVSYRALGHGLHLAFSPNAAKSVFVDHPEKYEKLYQQLVPTSGNSSLILSGEQWKKRRDRNWPLFRGSVLNDRLAQEQAYLWKAVEHESPKQGTSQQISLFDATSDIAFAMAGRLFCGWDLAPSAQAVRKSFNTLADVDQWTLGTVFPPWRWLLMRMTRGYSDAHAHWMDTRAQITQSGDPDSNVPNVQNLWHRAMRDNPDPDIGMEALNNEVATMLAAGSHTSAATLGFTLHLLAHHQQWREQVEQEALNAWQNGPQCDSIDFNALPITRAVVLETMRLYPPIWIPSRRALEDHTLGDTAVKKGDVVAVPVFAIHRSAHHWDNPESFEPQRFLERSNFGYRYLPFGAGPRTCIGNRFALIKQVALVSAFIAQFKINAMPGSKPLATPDLLPGASLWGRKPYQLELTRRGG